MKISDFNCRKRKLRSHSVPPPPPSRPSRILKFVRFFLELGGPFVFAGRNFLRIESRGVVNIDIGLILQNYGIAVENWMRSCKTRTFLRWSIKWIRTKRTARNLLRKPRVTEKEEWEEGGENGKDAGWRGLHFLVDDVSIPGNSPRYARNHFCAVRSLASSPDRPVYFLYFLLPREMLRGRGRCESRERKQRAPAPFIIASRITRVSRPFTHRKQTEAKYLLWFFGSLRITCRSANTNKSLFRGVFINPISFRETYTGHEIIAEVSEPVTHRVSYTSRIHISRHYEIMFTTNSWWNSASFFFLLVVHDISTAITGRNRARERRWIKKPRDGFPEICFSTSATTCLAL